MKRFVILIAILLGCLAFCKAQEGYRVSGKIDGVPDGTLLLMTDENGKSETLSSTSVVNGAFVFTGKVDTPIAAYITTKDQKSIIPLILENANFMVNAGKTGVLIKGGEQQEIYSQFSKVNLNLLREQKKITEEFQVAEQNGDRAKMQTLAKQLEDALVNAQRQEKELLRKYADTYVAAHVVAAGMQQLDEEVLKARYALLGEAAKATVPGRSIAVYLEELGEFSEGNVAPDFTVASPEGDSLSLYPLKGKLKLINFWASNQSLCREFNVKMLALYQQYHLKGLEIISVSNEQDRFDWIKAINADGLVWKNGLDRNSAIFHRYHVKKLPCTFLLDGENRIIAKDLPINVLQKRIGELLKQYKRAEKK